ncbi:trypsin, alkaline C-like [Plodia interpunctella]|uniref:trypsin, alkaline C-like n=1 Tax=Plodia interpunctella TaxID=58824 RepID=UPI002368D6BD|nr:trypsin, alkaline C-like [Plodia interpunctella]
MRALLLLALVGVALAAPKSGTRIVGGESTTVEQYPYMSNMLYHLWGIWWTQWCGGSLITQTAVLSAAHCYEGDLASAWQIRLGSSFASSGGQVIPASQLVLHAQYDGRTIDNDIAIIRLSSAAVLSNSVGLARVAGPNYQLPDNTVVTAIGWGALTQGGSSPEQLQHVDVNIINQELCAERYAYLKTQPGYQNWPDVTDGMLCAGILDVGGKDACQGDSGGPLSHDSDVVVGITSWGFGCAHAFYPGVNARVSSYTQWIVDNA